MNFKHGWLSGPPWHEMNKLLREMNEIFQETPLRHALEYMRAEEFPPVNMWSNEEEIIVTVDAPGMDSKELNINVLEDTLLIQGKREAPTDMENATCHRQERICGTFRRAFKLPFKIEQDKVTARYEKGILEVRLPRSEREKPRRISITHVQ